MREVGKRGGGGGGSFMKYKVLFSLAKCSGSNKVDAVVNDNAILS